MLELEFNQFLEDGMKVNFRVSFLNTSLFYPTTSQIRKWDKGKLRDAKPHSTCVWEKKHLQSLLYWITHRLKYDTSLVRPVYVADARALNWIFRQYKDELQMHWKRKGVDETYLKWKFMVGKSPEWGSIHVHASYPKFPESNEATMKLDTLPQFNKQKAFQFLKDHPNMMIRYKQLVPAQMDAVKFFELYYKDLFSIAYGKEDILCVHRQAAMLRKQPVLQDAYNKYVPGVVSHTDFFRFAISRSRVDEGIDEQQLGNLKMDHLFESLKEEEKKHYQTSVAYRLSNADAAFDLRLMQRRKDGYGIWDNNLPYDVDIENPNKKVYCSSINILQQINRRSDRLLNK